MMKIRGEYILEMSVLLSFNNTQDQDIQNTNFPVVLHGCESWFITLKEEINNKYFKTRYSRK